MQKTDTTIVFTCPECKEEYEFDNFGKNQFVLPNIQKPLRNQPKGNTLRLECLNVSTANTEKE